MAFQVDELKELLAADPSARILIVEGEADLQLWRKVTATYPDAGSVYPISEIILTTNLSNNRDRCLDLAAISSQWQEAARLNFFIDADNDHALGAPPIQRVWLTDGRDLESYCLDPKVFETVCVTGCGLSQTETNGLLTAITQVVRPLSVLRVLSARDKLNLPFRSCYPEDRLRSVFKKKGTSMSLALLPIVLSLLQHKHGNGGSASKVLADHTNITSHLSPLSDNLIVHGKDLTAFLAKFTGVEFRVISGIMRLALHGNVEVLLTKPNFSTVAAWLIG